MLARKRNLSRIVRAVLTEEIVKIQDTPCLVWRCKDPGTELCSLPLKTFEQKSDKSVLKKYLNSCISRINPHPLFIILVHWFLIFFLELPSFILKVAILQQESWDELVTIIIFSFTYTKFNLFIRMLLFFCKLIFSLVCYTNFWEGSIKIFHHGKGICQFLCNCQWIR